MERDSAIVDNDSDSDLDVRAGCRSEAKIGIQNS